MLILAAGASAQTAPPQGLTLSQAKAAQTSTQAALRQAEKQVVERVPVKMVLDEQPPAGSRIRPGMSLEPEVKVQ